MFEEILNVYASPNRNIWFAVGKHLISNIESHKNIVPTFHVQADKSYISGAPWMAPTFE